MRASSAKDAQNNQKAAHTGKGLESISRDLLPSQTAQNNRCHDLKTGEERRFTIQARIKGIESLALLETVCPISMAMTDDATLKRWQCSVVYQS